MKHTSRSYFSGVFFNRLLEKDKRKIIRSFAKIWANP